MKATTKEVSTVGVVLELTMKEAIGLREALNNFSFGRLGDLRECLRVELEDALSTPPSPNPSNTLGAEDEFDDDTPF